MAANKFARLFRARVTEKKENIENVHTIPFI